MDIRALFGPIVHLWITPLTWGKLSYNKKVELPLLGKDHNRQLQGKKINYV